MTGSGPRTQNLAETGGSSATPYLAGGAALLLAAGAGSMVFAHAAPQRCTAGRPRLTDPVHRAGAVGASRAEYGPGCAVRAAERTAHPTLAGDPAQRGVPGDPAGSARGRPPRTPYPSTSPSAVTKRSVVARSRTASRSQSGPRPGKVSPRRTAKPRSRSAARTPCASGRRISTNGPAAG